MARECDGTCDTCETECYVSNAGYDNPDSEPRGAAAMAREGYQLYANDTYSEVWAVRRGHGHRMTGLVRVPVTTTAEELPTLAYQTEKWRMQWFNRNIKWFRQVNPAVRSEA